MLNFSPVKLFKYNRQSGNRFVSIDSVQHAIDTLQNQFVQYQPPTEEDVPFSGITDNFPEFVIDTPSDSLETSINNGVSEILQAYDTIQYLRIASSYSWTQSITSHGQEGEQTFVIDETKEETRLWLFDRTFKLRGFTKEVKYNEEYGTRKESAIYLFSNDALIAVSERTVDSYEVEEITVVRILASQFPRGGFMRHGQSENATVSYLTKEDLTSREKDFFESLSELIATLKTGRKNAAEDDTYFQFEVNRTQEAIADKKADAVTYPVSFMVEKDLYPNYISLQQDQ